MRLLRCRASGNSLAQERSAAFSSDLSMLFFGGGEFSLPILKELAESPGKKLQRLELVTFGQQAKKSKTSANPLLLFCKQSSIGNTPPPLLKLSHPRPDLGQRQHSCSVKQLPGWRTVLIAPCLRHWVALFLRPDATGCAYRSIQTR